MTEPSHPQTIRRRPQPPARSGTFRIAAVAVLVVVAAVVLCLALRGNGGSSTSNPTSNVSAVTAGATRHPRDLARSSDLLGRPARRHDL